MEVVLLPETKGGKTAPLFHGTARAGYGARRREGGEVQWHEVRD